MRSLMVFAVLLASLLVAQSASAAKPPSKERQAKRACLSGDYAKGVGILADLFLETNDPTYLYNQGRCYEQNVRYVEAAERFKEYLRKAPNLAAGDKAEVDKHIADCETAAARGQARNQPSPEPAQPPVIYQASPAAAPTTFAVPPPASSAGSPESALTSPPPTAPTSSVVEHPWQHTSKWVATGAAVAFLGFGIIEHATYYSKNSDYNKKDCISDPSGCKSLADSADKAQVLAIVGYGAAAFATGAAITFWLMDSPKAAPAAHAGVGLSCAPLAAGVACRGRFW
jgi:tetratricopeptide (TPR) repeat protein